ncbi:hypothetical protein SCP_0410310 [Sparassis crispa]|uniref:Uncharacterized protein n=1 Tax=Sparassis crispa TaxID=139825 RepID=A0A401GKF6_9APHY|nr:hypothetical protein SCP_0410310 [Sparassis crispa]GBE82646.1 hypothetical protein SCP_0410310 [Sparassis crispa]
MPPSVKEKWDAMSHDERIVLTDLLLKKLEEQRAMQVLSVQNVSINAFHDVRSNLTSIQDQIEALHVRTGTEVLMVTIRSSNDHFNWLHVFFTSNCLSDFFAVVLNMQLTDIAMQMESYCLSSIQGLINNSHDQMMELKSHITKLINDQFREVTDGGATRLYYTNFDKKIMEKYGVVIEGWPLTKFCSPSDVRSRSEIEILCRAWESGETQFHKLSHKEYEAWSDAQFQTALDIHRNGEEHADDDTNNETGLITISPPLSVNVGYQTLTYCSQINSITLGQLSGHNRVMALRVVGHE